MEPFSLPLSENAVITGLRTPAFPDPLPKDTPLIVAIHGGGYSSGYYNATPKYSAGPYSKFLRVPFLALDRPGYKGSTAIPPPIPNESTYLQEEGEYLHYEILPAIWKAYSEEYGISSIVVLAHSLSVPMTVVAAASHSYNARKTQPAQNKSTSSQMTPEQPAASEHHSPSSFPKAQAYPLAGIILSGYGTSINHETMSRMQPFLEHHGDRLKFPAEIKDDVMLNKSSPGVADPEIFEKTEELNTDVGLAELVDSNEGTWGVWRHQYMPYVRCPVLYNLAGEDNLWAVNGETLSAFADSFVASARIESGIVPGAAHCMELSRFSKGWYARVFGWAVECGVGHGLGKS
ncbi:MAG: hypothetical protein Q9218_006277 [Villophora microphyllina]